MEPFILPALPNLETLKQFLRFGIVGGMGFVVDTTVVYLLLDPLGVYWAGALAYPVAASSTGRSTGSGRSAARTPAPPPPNGGGSWR